MSNLTPEAVKLLRRVQKHIKEEKNRWSWSWGFESTESPCGTKACIGGWTVILSHSEKEIQRLTNENRLWTLLGCSTDARDILGLDQDQANRLFFQWPEQFWGLEASDAVKRIDFFIKTDGTDVLPAKKPRGPRKSLKAKEIQDLTS